MTDLETRVRDALIDHAAAAGEWRVRGGDLRGAAADRAARRRRAAAVAGGTLAVAMVMTADFSLITGGGSDSQPPPGATDSPTSSPTTTATGPRPELMQVPVSDEIVQQTRFDLALGTSELLATAALPRSADTLLVYAHELAGDDPRTVVDTVTLHRGRPLVGTVAWYHPGDDLVIQPARDGDGDSATMVVIAPAGSKADSVEVTTSLPGKDLKTRTATIEAGIALVPVTSPHEVTRLRLLSGSEVEQDRIPGAFYLGDAVPRSLPRVAASEGDWQKTQVRTDGTTACRVTVNGMDGPESFSLNWDMIDEACAEIDGGLQLLLAEDRHYSSVAGLAPVGTDVVKLFWRVGKDTESNDVPVTRTGPVAFIDTSNHRPDQLIRAEAWNSQGDILDEVTP